MVQNVSGFELVRELRVVVVAELPNLDQRAGDQRLEKHDPGLARDRMQRLLPRDFSSLRLLTRACLLPGSPFRMPIACGRRSTVTGDERLRASPRRLATCGRIEPCQLSQTRLS